MEVQAHKSSTYVQISLTTYNKLNVLFVMIFSMNYHDGMMSAWMLYVTLDDVYLLHVIIDMPHKYLCHDT